MLPELLQKAQIWPVAVSKRKRDSSAFAMCWFLDFVVAEILIKGVPGEDFGQKTSALLVRFSISMS